MTAPAESTASQVPETERDSRRESPLRSHAQFAQRVSRCVAASVRSLEPAATEGVGWLSI